MEAKDCRKIGEESESAILRALERGQQPGPDLTTAMLVRGVWEIAAQLAESNTYTGGVHRMHAVALSENIAGHLQEHLKRRHIVMQWPVLLTAIQDALAIPQAWRKGEDT